MRLERIDYLKGFAILTVLINHYLNNYVSGNRIGFANGFTVLFFLAGGYLAYFSLEGRHKKFDNKVDAVSSFYLSKLLRVIPIYWLALAVGIFIFKERHSIMEFATIKSVSIFWFISAIVHCYLLAPLLYYTLRKLKTTQYLLVISLSFFVLNFTFYSGSFQGTTANYLNKISALDYRGLFLSHILLFGLGMAVPLLNWKHKLIQKCNEYCLLIVLFVLVDQTRGSSVNKLTSVAFIFGSAVVFSFFMHRKNRLVFTRILSFMGKYAYSIYLFHLFFYIKLSSLGIIQYNSIQSVLRTIALLPILFILCALVEKTFSKISDCIKHLTNRVIGI